MVKGVHTPVPLYMVHWQSLRVGHKYSAEIGRVEAVDACLTLFEGMLSEGEGLQALQECVIKVSRWLVKWGGERRGVLLR